MHTEKKYIILRRRRYLEEIISYDNRNMKKGKKFIGHLYTDSYHSFYYK